MRTVYAADVSQGGEPVQAVPNSTELVGRLETVVENLTRAGLLDKAYLYGFDETPYTNASIAKVYERFGTVKRAYPFLKTHATLNWPELRDDFEIDVWINEFGSWGAAEHYRDPTPKSQARQRWLAGKSGRSFWWYWCFWNLADSGCVICKLIGMDWR